MKINTLQVGMRHVSVRGTIVHKSETMEGYSQYGGVFRLSHAKIADDTGAIQLNLWNQQIDIVSIGDTVHIEASQLSVIQYNGINQINVRKRHGKITVIQS